MSTQAEYKVDGIDAFAPPQSYAVHNATDEVIVLRYDGEERYLPPFSKVAEKVAGRMDGPVVDSHGKARPGTLCIYDVPGERGICDGGRPPYWSARDAIKHALGIDTKRGIAVGPAAEKGISFIPVGCPDDQFAKIAREGRARYMLWMEKHATEVVSAYDERNNNRVKAGMGRIPGDGAYQRALAILEASRRREMAGAEDLMKTFEAQMAAPIVVADDDEDFKRFCVQETDRVIRRENLQTDTGKLVESLTTNPEAMAMLRQKYKVRKLRDSRKADGSPVVLESDDLADSAEEQDPKQES